jgi:OmcA/MtrC family decaheme c-type cytochrome
MRFAFRASLPILGLALVAGAAQAVTVEGGGNKRRDCLVQFLTDGVGFPAGASRFKGVTCRDGDTCDGDGVSNGACRFLALFCLNQASEALPQCAPPASVTSVAVSGKVGKGKSGRLDTTDIDQAIADLGLPREDEACTAAIALDVPVQGPDGKGEFRSGRAKLKAKSSTSKGNDKDRYQLVCLPGPNVVPPSSTTTSTSVPGSTTTSTSTLPEFARPGSGLVADIVAAAVAPDGTVTVDLTLTDDHGVPLIATTSSTDDPDEARVRITIARLEVVPATSGSVTTDFTRYVNYVTRTVSGGGRTTDQPTYDSGGSFELLDLETGLWRYTFGTMLPAGFPADLTHTVGAQIERVFDDADLVANPLLDFVPDGSPVTTVREVTTTAQCNGCHDPLALHGGGRREVQLCQLCHTDQAIDPESGETIDLKHLVHRIHRGKDLPSIEAGPVGTRYVIFGNQGSEHVYGEKVNVCAGGELGSVPCETDGDCPGGTCTGESTVGVGFPREHRDCGVCHSEGATAENALERPNVLACTGCHDDVNPGETAWEFLPAPGDNHPGPSHSEALCNECHRSTIQDGEFDISVPGAHVLETRSAQLSGFNGEILDASGAPDGPLTIQFRLTDDQGTPLMTVVGLNRVALAASGPSSDFGGASNPLVTATIAGGGASGTLMGPDGAGVFTYTTATNLPADAEGTWRVGLEARRSVSLVDADGSPTPTRNVNEAIQNPVFDFSVDGSEVEPRRTVVDIESCGTCHGVFSETFSIHGNLRNQIEYCVVCHNPNESDFAQRRNAVGATQVNESINLKHLLHKIHTGEELAEKPYIIYGFGAAPHDFSEVLYPGDLRNCDACHVGDSQTLPLPAGLLPTAITEIDTSGGPAVEVQIGSIPPIRDACLTCHGGDAAAAHAETNTTAGGAEACAVCHGEGSSEAVSAVHAREG